MNELDKNELVHLLNMRGFEYEGALGKGAFATVHKILHKKYNEYFCAKTILLDHLTSSKAKNDYQAEISALMNLCHPNIIKIYDHFEASHFLIVILEYCNGGSLHDILSNQVPITPPLFWSLAKQIILGFDYCHERKLAHCDIKPANILIDKYGRPKIADFGLSRICNQKSTNQMIGSFPYMAPELFNKHIKLVDPLKTDVWSLGITFFVMACGRIPWLPGSEEEVKAQILRGYIDYPRKLDPKIISFLQKILVQKPNQRLTMAQINELKELKTLCSFGSSPTLPPLYPKQRTKPGSTRLRGIKRSSPLDGYAQRAKSRIVPPS